jgi:putative flippase GtrA
MDAQLANSKTQTQPRFSNLAGWRLLARARQMFARCFQRFPAASVCKWGMIGLFFMGVNLTSLSLLVGGCGLPVPVATLVTAAVVMLLRFLANDRFVFQQRRPTWARLRAYGAAVALGAGVWYAVVNGLTLFGVHYLLSAIAATCCSVGFTFTANFLWVWRDAGLAQKAGDGLGQTGRKDCR